MAIVNFTAVVPEEGATFIFSSWVCVVDGACNFYRYLVETTKPKTSASTFCRPIDDLGEIQLSKPEEVSQRESGLCLTSVPVIDGVLGLDSVPSAPSSLGLQSSASHRHWDQLPTRVDSASELLYNAILKAARCSCLCG